MKSCQSRSFKVRNQTPCAAKIVVAPASRSGKRTREILLEALEPRQLLAAGDPFINEFLASNGTGIKDDSNPAVRSDWIEIRNPGASLVNMAGWTLTDDKSVPGKWAFPTGTKSNIAAGGYLLVFADGSSTSIGPGGKLHANFSLSSSGEYLALAKPDGTIITSFDQFPPQVTDVSYGSISATSVGYMATPTPGAANSGGAIGIAADTKFSVDDGYYDDPFDVVISAKQANAIIYYTRDGRSPLNTNGTISSTVIKYTGPIHVAGTMTLRAVTTAPGYVNSDVDTQTYLFAQQIVNQADVGNVAGFPTQWVNSGGTVVSYPTAGQAKYGMTPTVVSKYASEIVNDLKSLPAISLVMNPDDLFGTGTIKGIYSNSTTADNGTSLWERAMSAEMIFPDGTQGFQINGGVQMQGGGSRDPSNTPKHSLRLVFKTQYGVPHLNYKVFDDSDVTQFDSLILKAQYNNTWTHCDQAQRNRAQYVNDQWASDMEGSMGDPTKHGRYVQLYLNGVYWGMYSLIEHPNDAWAASYLGGNKDDYDVYDNESVLISGNSTAFTTMFSLANQMIAQAGQNQSTDSTYQQLQQYLDVPSFIDFMVLNQYGGNQDWDSHNYYAVRHSRNNGVATTEFGGFRYLAFDSEHVLEGETQNVTGLNTANGLTRLYQALKMNPEFRLQFADRAHQLMFNNGPLTAANAKALYLQETAKVFPALATEEARWGTYRKDYRGDATVYYSRDPIVGVAASGQWTAEKNRLTVKDTGYSGGNNSGYFSVRGGILLNQYRSASSLVYPTIDAAEWNQFGGAVTAGFTLTVANLAALPAGAVLYYTTDGTDPRLTGGAIAAGALVYPGNATGIIVSASEKIFMRVYVPATQTWSASTVATFFVGPAPKLRVAEMMYNPLPGSLAYAKDDYEFIELQNTGAMAIDPSGIQFTNGITFSFPAGSAPIPAGGRIVLVRNPAAYQERYGSGALFAGTYTGELSDSGETITLATALGQEIESFNYKDGWYDQTDGGGFSLVANDPDASDVVLSSKDGWRSSEPVNGNPGGEDVGLINNSVLISEVLATATSGTNWIEFKNTTDAPIDISDWFLSDDSVLRQKFEIADGSIVPAHGYFSISQTDGFGSAFLLSALGGAVYLTSNDGEGAVGGYRDSIDYGAADPDVSFGKYIKSTGGSDFTAMSVPTRDGDNAYPRVGPVVINEIMYNPFGLAREYVELRNITDAPVSLAGWTFSDGINFTFGPSDVIPADGYLLVVPIDPLVYRSTYDVPANAVVVGPFTGSLNNGGEEVTLSKPGTAVGNVTPMITVDQVNYDNNAPWPTLPDGTGPSVGRISAIKYGNDPINWRADAPDGTGGAANAFAPQIFSGGFSYGAGPTITIKFSKDVGASLSVSDLSIANLTKGTTVDPQQVTFSYDPTTQTATWQLAADLADGNYHASMVAANVTDAQSRTLDANGDGTAGDDYSYDFFHLAGDANHDRTVGFADLVAVAQNYGASGGKTYAQGDFNFDGAVNFSDLVTVAQHYGVSLAAIAAPAMPAAAPVPVAGASVSQTAAQAPVVSAKVLPESANPVVAPAVGTVKTVKHVTVIKPVAKLVAARAGSSALKVAKTGVPQTWAGQTLPAAFVGFGKKKIDGDSLLKGFVERF